MPTQPKHDAIALLKADHRKVEDLFEKFEKARSDRKQALVQEICTELCIHAMIEEEIFYPACKGKIEDDDMLEESYVEHDGAKVLIAELLDSEPDAEFYDAKVTVLSEMIKHHVKEEEKRAEGLFAQAKEAGLDTAGARRAPAGAQAGADGGVQARRQAAAAAHAQLHRPRAGAGPSGERRRGGLTIPVRDHGGASVILPAASPWKRRPIAGRPYHSPARTSATMPAMIADIVRSSRMRRATR